MLEVITIKNSNNLSVTLLNYGAIIQSIKTPEGCNLVLGFDCADDYLTNNIAYLGAVIGRVANRISDASFSLNHRVYQLDANEYNQHCLHSGRSGLHQVFWQVDDYNDHAATMRYRSIDGEGGFPGNVDIQVHYHLSDDNVLTITYQAVADRETPLDLTNHTYWNLAGSDSILNHRGQFNSQRFLASSGMVPTGELVSVKQTPLDFTTIKSIGRDIDQLKKTKGYDHYYIADDTEDLKLVATIEDPDSVRRLVVYTTEPGFQFYTGNFLTGAHQPYQGLCIETQHYPNAVNRADFPSVLISPLKPYHSMTQFKLDVG